MRIFKALVISFSVTEIEGNKNMDNSVEIYATLKVLFMSISTIAVIVCIVIWAVAELMYRVKTAIKKARRKKNVAKKEGA